MIELFSRGTTDFSKRGITLAAQSADVNFQNDGRYDLDIVMPYNAVINIDYGMILRCPVPKQHVGAITLGTVEYWEIASGQSNVPLYKTVPVTNIVRYENWQYGKEYAIGDKVSYDNKNYQAATAIVDVLTTAPPVSLPNNWTEIARTKTTGGGTLNTLNAGDQIVKTGDFNSTYMKAADTSGHEGFIQISKCIDLSESETKVIPAQDISEQSFTITEIKKSTDGKTVSIHAEHISYDLGKVIVGDCNISRATPATALLFLQGAMMTDYAGELYTNLTGDDALITADFSWKNAQNAILDPKGGFLQATTGHLLRNDLNVFLLAEEEANPRYRISYGVNMKSVRWTGDVGNIVTRIYPIAQNEDGSTLLLPELYIDTVRTVPFIRPEVLNTGLKVGQKEKQEDGSEIELDVDTVFSRMREAANNRFTVDECDKAELTLEVDWEHLPDTEEYKEYAALQNAAPGDWALVIAGPLGINETIQLTGYTFDAILGRYKKGTFGKKKVSSSVPGYALANGAVSSRTLANGAVSSQNIQAGSITAREIEANSITAEHIASKAITTELLQAGAVTADEIAAGSITTVKLAAQAITAEKIAAGAITAGAIGANTIQAEHIMSGAVTTDKLAAGSVEASKIAALAITTDKLAANAITTEKLAAGSITAAKIDTADLTAIQATLQIANIANAQIASADIGYAQVKELNAQSAYFGQAVIQAGLANKLYVPRLSVGYAQMIGATIGDLVVQASDGNFYGIDVDLSGNVVATQRTVTSEEIASGHTTDGRQLVLDTDILAENLDTNNLTASHALMYSITANIIDVDQLWAREAFVNKLMVQDISSNTYIQATIGDWQSQSTITQTVDGINTRITSLGYGTFFYSETEPDPSGVVAGDVWVQPIDDNTWADIANYTWDELSGMTWEQVAGQYRMYVWTGSQWKILFDNMIISQLETEISQNRYAITLKANQSEVDTLSGDVTNFAAVLDTQAQQITAAVSSVNQKTATYVRITDPADDPNISLNAGDTWAKSAGNGTWNAVDDYTWDQIAELTWDELAGTSVYTWNGSAWLPTGDYGAILQNRTMLELTDTTVTLMAEEQRIIGGQVEKNTAQITIESDRITQEVARAVNAENGKISKTSQYQTADEIVSEAVSQSASAASGLYIAKSGIYITPESIVTESVRQASSAAAGSYIAKAGIYVSAEAIKNEAVRVSGINASEAYLAKDPTYDTVTKILNQSQAQATAAADSAKNASIAKTETYATADAIVNSAIAATDQIPIFNTSTAYVVGAKVVYDGKIYQFNTAHAAGAWNPSQVSVVGVGSSYIAKTTQYATADSIYMAAQTFTTDYAYHIQSGITITAAGIDISGSQYVRIASGGYFSVLTGDFGIDTSQSGICIWAGAANSANAYFRVKKNGEVTLTKLLALNEQGTESEVNLRTANLWKLSYGTVKSVTVQNGYVTQMTFSNAVSGSSTVNFKHAITATLRKSGWDGNNTLTVDASNDPNVTPVTETLTFGTQASDPTVGGLTTISQYDSNHKGYGWVKAGDGSILRRYVADAGSVYTEGRNSVGITSVNGGAYYTSIHQGAVTVKLSNGVERTFTVTFTQY